MDDHENTDQLTESLSLDTVYTLLAHQRRRHIISCLHEHGSLALSDLATEVACREQDTSIAKIPEEDVLPVYSSLWHVHIPKLAEADVVEYDQDRDFVEPGDNADIVRRLLQNSSSAGDD